MQAGGGFAFAGTDLQGGARNCRRSGPTEADLTEAGGGKGNPALIETYIANQLETYEWLRRNGVEFSLGTSSTPGAVSRVHGTRQGAAGRVSRPGEAESRIRYVDADRSEKARSRTMARSSEPC